MDISSRQKIKKETAALSDTLDQMGLIDILRVFYPKADYTFFSNAHGTIARKAHMLGHKTSLNKLRRMTSYQTSPLTITV